MKYLFVHQNFPGQFLHLVRHLVAQKRHEIVFITEPNQNVINGVKKVPYRKPDPPSESTHWTIRELELGMRRAEIVAATAVALKGLGFVPDIVIGHHGWGELLNIPDVWPGVPILGYFEFFYRTEDSDVGFDPEFPVAAADFPRIRAKNAINLLALTLGGGGQTPTAWQHSTYPAWARKQISIVPEGVDLDVCKPDRDARRQALRIGDWEIKPDEKLVTYVSRDLEPYRGCHIVLRALPRLLAERKDVRVVMVGGDGTSYGAAPVGTTWKRFFLDQLGSQIDSNRVLFPGRIPYQTYVRMLQRSNAHIYFTYPFVASWSLREALAAGAPVIGSDTTPVREFIRPDQTGLLTPFFDPDTLTENVLRLLENADLSRHLGAASRKWAEANLAMPAYLASYNQLIQATIGASEPAPAARKSGLKPVPKPPFDGQSRTPTSVKQISVKKAKANATGRARTTAGTRGRA